MQTCDFRDLPRVRPSRTVHRNVVALGIAALVLASYGSTAQAAPVRSASTPLLLSGDLPTVCPAAPDLDGRTFTRRSRRVLPTVDPVGAYLAIQGLSAHPAPAITICDPELAAARQLVGPFGGDAAETLDEDIVGFGIRSIGVGSHQFERSALQVGDRITLPAVGPRAQLDLSVRTVGGARSVRIPALGAGASSVRIAGTAAAPSVVVERAGLPPAELAVKPQPRVVPTVTASVRGRTAHFQTQAAPGTFVVVLSNAKGRASNLAVGQTDQSGDATPLPLRALRRGNRTAEVMFANLALRRIDRTTCVIRWTRSGDRLRSVRCRAKAGSSAASRLSFGSTVPPALAAGASALPGTRSGRLARPTVETTLATVMQTDSWYEYALSPDVNGDGRPDAIGTDADDGRSTLVVSQPGGWRPIPLRYPVDPDYTLDSIPEVVPDVTGDGRAELRTADGRFVTDAFSGPAPAAVDLRATRSARPGDLDLGGPSLTSKERNWRPRGILDDRTGDARPELVLGYGSASAVFASQDVVVGRVNRMATPTPLTIGRTYAFTNEDAVFDFSDSAILGAPRRDTLTRNGRLWTAEPADGPATGARSFLVRARDATGQVTASTTVTLKGTAQLLDVDDVSGDVLISTSDPACEAAIDELCEQRIDRVSAQGTTLATLDEDGINGAMFVADGPDLDLKVDVVAWTAGSESPDPDFAYVPSTSTGALTFVRLATLAAAGTPLKQAGPTTAVVLADGSRWLGLTVDRSTRRRPATVLVLAAPKP